MENIDQPAQKLVPAADKLIRMTEFLLNSSEVEYGVSEIASALSLSKGTVHSILQTMMASSWVEQNAVNGKYYLTSRLPQLIAHQEKQSRTVSVFTVIANQIERDCGELVNLHYLDGLMNARVVAKIPSTVHTIRVDLPEGATIPVICSSAGKCLVSQMEDRTLRRIYDLSKNTYTQHTIRSEEEFLESVHNVREFGYALNNAEFEDGVYSVAAPLFNKKGIIVAAINIVIPYVRFTEDRKAHLIDLVLDASKRFSEMQ